jgi:hypothetical protein
MAEARLAGPATDPANGQVGSVQIMSDLIFPWPGLEVLDEGESVGGEGKPSGHQG